MPCERKPMRYSHSEGLTEVCFDQTGQNIVTCGNDGDVRIFEGFDDDDPKFITVGEKVYSLTLKNGKLVTASSSNAVQIHSFPDGEPDGILTRFTTNATHVCFNGSGTRVAAGSSDFLVKVIEVSDVSQQKTFRGHEAPVLSVALDPTDHFLASSSCDGTVAVWNIDDQSQVISWPLLQKCNDVSAAVSLCRLSWQPGAGQFLAVPVGSSVQVYQRGSWSHVTTLSDPQLTMPVHVVVWSPCAGFLGAGSAGGSLTVWNFNTKESVERVKHEKGFAVCSLAWSPSGKQIAFTDTEGCLGLLDGLGSAHNAVAKPATAQKSSRDFDALFDDDDDGLMDEGRSDTKSPPPSAVNDDDDDDDDGFLASTGRARKRGAVLEDENSLDTGSIKLGGGEEVSDGAPPAPPPSAPPPPVYDGPMPTDPQRAFQPGSTPTHLTHRYMMWNSVGVVRSYSDDQDEAIDVEFHDSSVHHSLHLPNTLGHKMADLSQQALLLASPASSDTGSKIQLLHFSSSSSSSSDWLLDLPEGEGAWSVCLGRGWAAVATSSALLRLFSLGGVQREVISLPGNVVCTAAHGHQLMVAFHRATGFHGDQALGFLLLEVGGARRKTRMVVNGNALPLSHRATLSWMGFTAEGTPVYVDSVGVVRLLTRSLGFSWTPVGNTSDSSKSRSHHYWVVGVHEDPQQIRCIPCKGSRFPPTLPRPAVTVLPLTLPLCQRTTEKGQMEEEFWRSVLLHHHDDFLSAAGYEVDEESREQSEKRQQELLMKMFALSCKLERELRCVELAEMMTQSVLTLAIRYAAQSRRLGLAQQLGELARRNAANQEEEEAESWANQEEGAEPRPSRRRSVGDGQTEATPTRYRSHRQEEEEEEEEEQRNEEEEEEGDRRRHFNPFTKEPPAAATTPPTTASRLARSNPFKLPGSASSSSQPRLPNILDNMTANRRTAAPPTTARGSALKPLVPRAKKKTQSTLLQMNGSKPTNRRTEEEKPTNGRTEEEQRAEPKADDVTSAGEKTGNRKSPSTFLLYLDHNRKSILLDDPQLQESDVIRVAMERFRNLTNEERQSWVQRAKGQSGERESEVKKRKRADGGGEEEEEKEEEGGDEENEENGGMKKKKPSLDSSSSKLAAFAFSQS